MAERAAIIDDVLEDYQEDTDTESDELLTDDVVTDEDDSDGMLDGADLEEGVSATLVTKYSPLNSTGKTPPGLPYNQTKLLTSQRQSISHLPTFPTTQLTPACSTPTSCALLR